MNQPPEEMGAFFDARANGYEQHMRENVESVDKYYTHLAALVPHEREINLLDLGCGTGLELDEIYKINSRVIVTGIDLSENMLALLHQKHADKSDRLRLIRGSYFDVDFGTDVFDVAVSVQTLHHFSHERKTALYKKIWKSLKPGGLYIEADYTADSAEAERQFYARAAALGGQTDGYYHIDTPCCNQTQVKLLKNAGFKQVEAVARYGNTGLFKAVKG